MPGNPFEEKHSGMDEGHQSQKQVLNGNQKCSMHFLLFLLSLYQNCFIIPSSTYRHISFFFFVFGIHCFITVLTKYKAQT